MTTDLLKPSAPSLGITEFDPARVLATLERAMYGLPVLLLQADATRSLLPSMLARTSALSFGDEPQPYTLDGDVATLTISGPLYQRAFDMCGMAVADGYDAIATRARAAFNDQTAGAVLNEIDSPGGDAAGVLELADLLASMSAESGKPLVTYASERAASAAYWLGSASSSIVVPRSGELGSIGAIVMTYNEAAAMDAAGIKAIVAAYPSGKSAGWDVALSPPDGAAAAKGFARMQARAEDIARMFAADVAQRRGLTLDHVLGLDAQMFSAEQAVAKGLADMVGGRVMAMDLARSKIKRKAYSMGNGQGAPVSAAENLLAALCSAVGLDMATATPEAVEAAARSTKELAALGSRIVALSGVQASEAGPVVEAWKAHALTTLPKALGELKAREVQLAVSTGRMMPGQAYADDDAPREYPALPTLHPRLAAMSVDAVRAEAHLAAPLPQVLAPKAPKRAISSGVDPEVIKKAGFKDEAEYLAAINKYGPPPGMEISQ